MHCTIVKRLFAATVLTAGLFQMLTSLAMAEPGLLLIAHGAPMSQWNAPVLAFGERVAAEAIKSGRFKAVRTAMLEFTQPDVPGAVAELEAAGCDRIIAVPLFIAPSGHTHFDVPAVLGLYSSPSILATIAEEGGRVARPTVPITLTQTFAGDDKLLVEYALSEVKRLSTNPAKEAVILLAHGDKNHQLLVERLMRRATTYCCGRAGIDYGDWAFVEIGQAYATEGVGAICEALEHKKRILVVGIYVSSSAASIHHRAMARAKKAHPGFAPFEGKDVVFSSQGVITHPSLVKQVLAMATAALAQGPEEKAPVEVVGAVSH